MRILALFFLIYSPGMAQIPKVKEEAKRSYQAGVQAFKTGEFQGALKHFEHAYLLDNSPILLYNLARSHFELGELQRGIYYYELYLKRQPEAKDRAEVKRRIRVAKAFLEKQSSKEREAPKSDPLKFDPPEDLWMRPSAYISLGLGGLGLIASLAFGLQAQGYEDDFEQVRGIDGYQMQQAKEDAEEAMLYTNLSLVAGGIFLATGTTLFFLAPGDSGQISMSPAGLWWTGYF